MVLWRQSMPWDLPGVRIPDEHLCSYTNNGLEAFILEVARFVSQYKRSDGIDEEYFEYVSRTLRKARRILAERRTSNSVTITN